MQYQIESILRIPAASENPLLPRRKVAQNVSDRKLTRSRPFPEYELPMSRREVQLANCPRKNPSLHRQRLQELTDLETADPHIVIYIVSEYHSSRIAAPAAARRRGGPAARAVGRWLAALTAGSKLDVGGWDDTALPCGAGRGRNHRCCMFRGDFPAPRLDGG